MEIRRADEKDIPGINKLLFQIAMLHHVGRPDLFKAEARKYTDEELGEIIADNDRPILVASEKDGKILGYALCILKHQTNSNILTDVKTLYIDDLCVDEAVRGQHIGKSLYEAVLDCAKENKCYNVTLNVWSCNETALKFYESCGLEPQKIGMETILSGKADTFGK